MHLLKPLIRYALLLILAYYLAILSWSWLINFKKDQKDYLLSYQLSDAAPNAMLHQWYWLDQKNHPVVRKTDALNPERLGLKLVGLIGMPETGVAIFSIERTIKVIHLGEFITNQVRLSRIEQNFVVITDGVQEAIVPLEQSNSKLFTYTKKHSGILPERSAQTGTQTTNNRQQISIIASTNNPQMRTRLMQLKQDLKQKPLTVSKMVRFRQIFNQGKMEGIEVQPKENQDMFKALGFQPKDVILAIGGLSIEQLMQNPAQSAALLNASRLNFRIKRNNAIMDYQLVW